MPAHRNEKGGSTISNIVWLLILAAAIYCGWNVIPVYYDHWTLQDKALELSRLHPSVPGNKDDDIQHKMMRAIRDLRMDAYIFPQNVRIITRETSRMIAVEYSRDAQVLPGVKHTFKQKILVDSPFY